MHEARINNTVIRYPSQWDELNRQQLEIIVGLSLMNLTEMSFKTHLLLHLANIHVEKGEEIFNPDDPSEQLFKVKLRYSKSLFVSSLQIAALANGFDFLFNKSETIDTDQHIRLESQLTVNLITSFKVAGTTYYGPSDKLFNINFSEFIHAETNLKRFNETKEIKYLDRLVAVLYRPQDKHYDPESPDYKGDRRAPFNDHRIDERAEQLRKLNHNIRMCIYLFYVGCQWWIQQQFPHVFSYKGGDQDNKLGFLGMVDALTGGDVTKTEEIRSSYLMDVMVHLERSAIEYEIMKEKLKKK